MKESYKKKSHILCIDDDNKIRELITKFLQKNNFFISSSMNTRLADDLISFYNFDLIILDIMMPEESGLKFLERFRKKNKKIPILMLSALNQIDSKLKTYKIGSDDYLVKPFEPIELIFKINKLINPRINQRVHERVLFGEFEFDFNLKELRKNKKLIKLTEKEIMILNFLGNNLNKQVSRSEISNNLNIKTSSRTIDVFIARLRKKIENEDGSSFLKTIRGKGYILKSDYVI